MSEFDTSSLLDAIRHRGGLPGTDARFTDDALLSLATSEMRDFIAPLLFQARAEHGIYQHSATVTAGTAAYRMPERALGGALRDVVWTSSAGGSRPIPLPQKLSSDLWVVSMAGQSGPPSAYFIRNYSVVLVPTPDMAGTLSMPYYARPNKLVLPSACVLISGVSTSGSNWALTTDDAVFQDVANVDVVRGTPGFETILDDFGMSFDGTDTYELLKSEFDSVPEAGDWMCLTGESPVPQVPVEMHGLLAARVALIAVEGTGDNTATVVGLRRQCDDLERRVKQWLSPRVESNNMQAGGSLGAHPMMGVVGGGWR